MNNQERINTRKVHNSVEKIFFNDNKLGAVKKFNNQFESNKKRFNSDILKKIQFEYKKKHPIVYKPLIARMINLQERKKMESQALSKMKNNSNLFENVLHQNMQNIFEKMRLTREKFQTQISKLNDSYQYFNEKDWVVPSEVHPQSLTDIDSAEKANQFMKKNIVKAGDDNLLIRSLQKALNQDGKDMTDSTRILLKNVINALKKDIELYKVMLPTVFSIIDSLIREWLSEYIENFNYVRKDTINELNSKTQDMRNGEYKTLFSFYQSMVWIEKFNDYYPENSNENMEKLTRNSVAHGSFDYTNYTIHDFAKVALLIEHISGLRDFLEENSSNSL